MDKQKKDKKTEDLELPPLEEEIKDWCEVPTEADDTKSADDLEIDAWCQETTEADIETDVDSDKTKKNKK